MYKERGGDGVRKKHWGQVKFFRLYRYYGTSFRYICTMKAFLRQVAEHWYAAGEIGRMCFIFPNKRSLAFFRKYLSEIVAERSDVPVEAPALITIKDFFFRVTGMSEASRVALLLELYRCYCKVHPKPDSLDDFIFWGDVLLSDFGDVDKYLINPAQLFTNLSEFKDMRDSFSYLSETQRAAMERFLGHFQRDSGPAEEGKKDVKGSFLQVWNILLPLYRSFREALQARGLAYEGQVYRAFAERLANEPAADILADAFPRTEHFVFVGLNALNECERRVMRRMRDAGLASFCWDWSEGWMSDPQNKASVFMRDNLRDFPQAFPLEDIRGHAPRIDVLAVPSSVGQAIQLPAVLGTLAERGCGGDLSRLGIDTAVVLPDEALLMPVLNAIPPEIADINVTMGYPMQASGFHSFLTEICTMQMHLRRREDGWYFYHRQVHGIFSSGIFRAAAGEAGRSVAARVKAASQYYIAQAELSGSPVLEAIFRPVVEDPRKADSGVIKNFCTYICDVVRTVAPLLKDSPDMAVELDFAKECYLAVNRLSEEDLPVLPATFVRLLSQVLSGVTVPFTGEPLKGLQVMGPLETRALDFRNLVILSAGEGMFPRRSTSSSFIPPELRKGFGLPTYEYQDAVWAYYFYRMISRAENVWMLYDSRTEGLKAGEESRYIKQLELHYNAGMVRHVARAAVSVRDEEEPVPKTAEDVEAVRAAHLSASSLQAYLACPAKFYFHVVKRLRADEEVAESLDAGMIGNVFHDTMCALYTGPFAMDPGFPMDRKFLESRRGDALRAVSRDYIRSWMDRPADIRARIRSLVKAELNTFEVSGRNLVFEDVVFQYVMKVLERDLEHLERCGAESFEVLGLEKECFLEYDGFNLKGYIDRMDSFLPGTVRVVDYKTGKVEDDDIEVFDSNASKIVGKIFGPDSVKRPKIALQLFLYDLFVEQETQEGTLLSNSVYAPARLFVSQVLDVPASQVFISLMKESLSELLAEIADPAVPFARTADTRTCSMCDFKMICGR